MFPDTSQKQVDGVRELARTLGFERVESQTLRFYRSYGGRTSCVILPDHVVT